MGKEKYREKRNEKFKRIRRDKKPITMERNGKS
jgi:hypothetical protein